MSISNYRPDPRVYDELLAPDGSVRATWGSFGPQLVDVGPARLANMQERAARRLVSTGAAHLVADLPHRESPDTGLAPNLPLTGSHSGTHRQWPSAVNSRFDPVPVVITEPEWQQLEVGIQQRVRLLELILADLYGPRQLLSTGKLPPAAILGTPDYLRTAIHDTAAEWIVRSAIDVVRDDTGQLLALGEVTDVPVGVGYSLGYRDVSARLVPEGLRSLSVRTASDWLASLQVALGAIAPLGRNNPRSVVLARTQSPNFIDHSVLATHLGYHLAEDLDLAVDGARLVMRSLDGLEPVDSVLRCTDDFESDPLDVHGSIGGVPGLVALNRRGGIGMANPLGSGLGGNIALLPFLPELCRALLGEELLLQGVPSIWCGDQEACRLVLSELEQWTVYDTIPQGTVLSHSASAAAHGEGIDHRTAAVATVRALSTVDVELWRERIRREPRRFVAQRLPRLATTPCADAGHLRPGSVVMRFFSLKHGPRVDVMPAGIGWRVDAADHVQLGPAATPSITKDVWIRGVHTAPHFSLVESQPPLPQIDLGSSIPTRAAETMFWMGRGAERADVVARLAAVVLARLQNDPGLLDVAGGALAATLAAALQAVSGGGGIDTSQGLFEPHGARSVGRADEERLLAALRDALGERSAALSDSTGRLVSSARSVRQFLSTSTWRVLAPLPIDAASAHTALSKRSDLDDSSAQSASDALDRIGLLLAGFAGLATDSLVRGPAWRFLEIGRRLERALLVLGLVENVLVELPVDVEQPAFETLLSACDSLVSYRRRYRSHLVVDAVAAHVITALDNPRAVAFQLEALDGLVAALPPRRGQDGLRQSLLEASILCGDGLADAADVLAVVLRVRPHLLDLADAIPRMWFRPAREQPRRVRAEERR